MKLVKQKALLPRLGSSGVLAVRAVVPFCLLSREDNLGV